MRDTAVWTAGPRDLLAIETLSQRDTAPQGNIFFTIIIFFSTFIPPDLAQTPMGMFGAVALEPFTTLISYTNFIFECRYSSSPSASIWGIFFFAAEV